MFGAMGGKITEQKRNKVLFESTNKANRISFLANQ